MSFEVWVEKSDPGQITDLLSMRTKYQNRVWENAIWRRTKQCFVKKKEKNKSMESVLENPIHTVAKLSN